jgi:hypothetical protein
MDGGQVHANPAAADWWKTTISGCAAWTDEAATSDFDIDPHIHEVVVKIDVMYAPSNSGFARSRHTKWIERLPLVNRSFNP